MKLSPLLVSSLAALLALALVWFRRYWPLQARLTGMGLFLALISILYFHALGLLLLIGGIAYSWIGELRQRPGITPSVVALGFFGWAALVALISGAVVVPLFPLPQLTMFGLTLLSIYVLRHWLNTFAGMTTLVISAPALYVLANGFFWVLSPLPYLWARALLQIEAPDRRAALVILIPVMVVVCL